MSTRKNSKEYYDNLKEKQCSKCKQILTISMFYRRKDRVNQPYQSSCKDCSKIDAREYRIKSIDKICTEIEKQCITCDIIYPIKFFYKNKNNCILCYKKTNQINRLKKNFNLTLEEYNYMNHLQDFKCKICKEFDIDKKGNKINLAVDHCHQTGKIRGLLCRRCNRLLGYATDNIKIINKSIEYLVKYDDK